MTIVAAVRAFWANLRGVLVYQWKMRRSVLSVLRNDPMFLVLYYQWLVLVYWRRGPVRTEYLRLDQLHHEHPVRWPDAVAKSHHRAERLRELDLGDRLDEQTCNRVMPSSLNITVGHEPRSDLYIVMEGNGRLTALREAFSDRPDLEIEVDVFELTPSHVRTLERLARQDRHDQVESANR